MTDLDFGAFDALTFDCYGTLIDWEAGILAALRTALPADDAAAALVADAVLLEEYANAEATLEAGPYRRYRGIAGEAMAAVARAHGGTCTATSVVGEGSVFELSFPLRHASHADLESPPDASPEAIPELQPGSA